VTNLWSRGEPCSAEVRAIAKMTYARIVACLAAAPRRLRRGAAGGERHRRDRARPQAVETAEQEAERRVQEFAAWCTVTERGQGDRAGVPLRAAAVQQRRGCSAYMGYTARVLRRRFVAAGLLVEGD
jgi:hypothetical protein